MSKLDHKLQLQKSRLVPIIWLVIVCFSFINNSFADISESIVTHQQKLLEQEQVNKEIEGFKEWELKAKKEIETSSNTDDKPSENCFYINEIKLEGNTVLSKSNVLKIVKLYQNTCITSKKIANIVSMFSNVYKDKGYITTYVYIKEQNLRSGTLVLTVIEGRVDNVVFGDSAITSSDMIQKNGNSNIKMTSSQQDGIVISNKEDSMKLGNRLTAYFISPLHQGEILNVRAIDQITDNMNNIPSYHYKTKIEPSVKSGYSNLKIDGSKSLPITPYAEVDTFGQSYTGHERFNIGSKFDNMLNLGDSINVKYLSTFNDGSDTKYSRSLSSNISIPFGYAKFGLNSSYSQYLTTIQGQNQSSQSTGSMINNSITSSYMIYRDKSIKTNLFSNLNLINSKNYINNSLSSVQSRNLANLELGVINNLYTKYGSVYHKLTYIRGLNSFGSIEDTDSSTYHAQYDAIRLYQLYNVKVDTIFNSKIPFTYQNTIDSQLTNTDVYSQNQFVLGGYYSVRGYRDVNIYGSSGILTRNDIDFSLRDYVRPISNGCSIDDGKSNNIRNDIISTTTATCSSGMYTNMLNSIINILTNKGTGGVSLGAFYDIGYVSSHNPSRATSSGTGSGTLSSGNEGFLSGAGPKVSYTSKHLTSSIAIGYSLNHSDYLSSSIKQNDGMVVYLNVRGSW